MAIRALYDTQDDIPEPYRELYEEREGKFHLTKIEGLVTDADVQRVRRALEQERNGHKQAKDTLKSILGDRKPEDLQAMLDRYPELEAAAQGKVDDTKLAELAEARARTRVAPLERKVNELTAALTEREQALQTFQQKEMQRTIFDAVRTAASKAKVLDTAVEDVLLLAERTFEVTDDGKVVTKGDRGGVSPEVWLTDMTKARPHWWPASTGGGARGGSGGVAGPENPWSAEGWNMTKQAQVIREQGEARASEFARAAGTRLGGPRPVKK